MTPLSLPQCAGQTLLAGFPGGPPPPELLAMSGRGELGGFVLFRRNVSVLPEAAALVETLARSAPARLSPLIAVDQEGGRVARFGPPVLRLPPARQLADLDDPRLTRRCAALLGSQLALLGVTLDFAPVLDVDSNPGNPVIGDRSFGRTAERVITHARAFAAGLADAGVLACGKHFPGHGDTAQDSHLTLPRLPHDLARLRAVELAPFAALARELPALMTAHVVFEALDPRVPATLSRRVLTELLRGELRYGGVVFSDDLEMKAVSDRYAPGELACAAIEAGCDALLFCSQPARVQLAHEALVRRAERDDRFAERLRDAAMRGLSLRRRHRSAPAAPDEIEARLRALQPELMEARLAPRPAS